MKSPTNPYAGFRFPAEIISHAVWLYHCFTLSFREIEEILAERSIIVSYETIRQGCLKFGLQCARINRPASKNAGCGTSNRLLRHNAFSPFMRPSTTSSGHAVTG